MREKTDASALWMGWIGVIAGVISFIYVLFLFSGVAVILGLITAFSKADTLGWWAISLGVVGGIANWWFY